MGARGLFTALLLLLPLLVFAQSFKTGKVEAKRNVMPNNYDFWLYKPNDYEPKGHPSPIVFFLHGRSLCGRDLNRVKKYGVIDAISKGKYVPALVVAPQTQGAWSPEKLNRLLEWMKSNYNVDSTRVYVIGMSLGGYGTMDFANAYPEKIAAGIAMCGGCTSNSPDNLGRLPFWIMHGTADRAVPITASKKVVEYLQNKGTTDLLRYDWMQGGSHGVYARVFYLQKTYDWLFSHTTTMSPQEVDRSFDITKEDISQTYNELKWFQNAFEDE